MVIDARDSELELVLVEVAQGSQGVCGAGGGALHLHRFARIGTFKSHSAWS